MPRPAKISIGTSQVKAPGTGWTAAVRGQIYVAAVTSILGSWEGDGPLEAQVGCYIDIAWDRVSRVVMVPARAAREGFGRPPDPHTGYLVLEWKLSGDPYAGDVQVGRSWDTTRTVSREPRLQVGGPSDGDLLADLDGRRVFGRLGKRPVVLDDLCGRQR